MARDIAAERKEIDQKVEGQTVCTLFHDAVSRAPDREALRWKEGDDWKVLNWREYGDLVRDVANGLLSLGLESGQMVNMIGANRFEHYVSDQASAQAGGTPVSLYNTLAPEQISYIVNHSEARFVFVENREFFERFLKVRKELDGVEKFILWEDAEEFADDDAVLSFDELCEAGRAYAEQNPGAFEERWKSVKPDDLATLIYTSGTTGPPKGVMVSHYNVTWTAESLAQMTELDDGSRQISYLPLAHIAERMTGVYLQMKFANICTLCPNPRDIASYLTDVRPQFFFAVPRIWEKMYQGVNAQLTGADTEQREAAEKAFAARLEKVRLEQAGKDVPAELEKECEEAEGVMSFIRSLVGLDELQVCSSGAAPLAAEIIEWYHALGIPIAEVYGQSEDTGPTSWNRPDNVKIGTVGPSIPGVEVKLADDGELLVRGGNVTQGYYKEPEKTAETFDSDGWLYSGDIAEIDDEGFIRIVDRKKEIIITAGGKNIAPSNSENLLKQYPLIGQVAVIGDRRPYLTALIVLDAEGAEAWASQHDKPADVARLATDPDVVDEVQGYVDEVNEHLHRQEQIKRFTILPKEWTAESEELTPTLKLKRRVIGEKYASEIEEMYAS